MSIPFVRHVERHAGAGQERTTLFLRQEIEKLVLGAAGHQGTVAEFLELASKLIKTSASSELIGEIRPPERARIERLTVAWDERSSRVSAGSNSPGPGAPNSFEAERGCFPEICEAFAFAESLVRETLEPFGIVLPAITFHTGYGNTLTGGNLHRDTKASFADDVTLVLPEAGFDSEDLNVLPYVLVHELICHVIQGASAKGARGDESGDLCPWTEGWMDCLALEVVVDRVCAGANGLPAWIGEADAAIVNAALDAHKARFRTPDPAKKNDYDLRRQTRDAWQGLKSAALQNGLDENQAEQLRRAFSIRYNALSVNGKERRALAVGLWSKLHTPGRARLAALSAIRDFIDNQDVARLHNALAV